MEKSGPSPAHPDQAFPKRTLSIQSFLVEGTWLVRNLPRLIRATRTNRLDDQFREKILLAVSAGNDCRYCTRVHASAASIAGIDDETIDRILASDIDGAVSEAERPALLFALQYAETDGNPEPDVFAALEAAYEPATAADVVAVTRAMHFANLLGNSVDGGVYAIERRIDRGLSRARKRCPT